MTGLQKIIIVAMTRERVIGLNGKMPWHISDDLKLFKKLTLGNTVIMGRATYDSIGKPLPKRDNIIVSAKVREIMGAVVCPTLESAVEKAENLGRDIFFIGGASIYQQSLPIADAMHISWVKKEYDGDTCFPEFDQAGWQETEKTEYTEFTHILYRKK